LRTAISISRCAAPGAGEAHGADTLEVMDVTRHRVETLKGYDRRAKAFRNHAGDGFL
jgi:hypothetical protein